MTIEKIVDEVCRLIHLKYNFPIYFESIPEIVDSNSFGVELIGYKVTSINKKTNLEKVDLLIKYLPKNDNETSNTLEKEKYKVIDNLKAIFEKGRICIENDFASVSIEYKQVISKFGLCLSFEYYKDAYSVQETNEIMNEVISVTKTNSSHL